MKKESIIVATGDLEDPKTGEITEARLYATESDAPCPGEARQIDPEVYASWKEADGTIGIARRTSSVSVGASAAYSRAYDSIDWGN